MMTKKEKNDKVADEFRQMAAAMGVESYNSLFTDMRRAYMSGAPIIVMIAGRTYSAMKQPAPAAEAEPGPQ